MANKRVIWTDEMVATLRALRAAGTPILECADRIGVGHVMANSKAVELGIAARMNFGTRSGKQRRQVCG